MEEWEAKIDGDATFEEGFLGRNRLEVLPGGGVQVNGFDLSVFFITVEFLLESRM